MYRSIYHSHRCHGSLLHQTPHSLLGKRSFPFEMVPFQVTLVHFLRGSSSKIRYHIVYLEFTPQNRSIRKWSTSTTVSKWPAWKDQKIAMGHSHQRFICCRVRVVSTSRGGRGAATTNISMRTIWSCSKTNVHPVLGCGFKYFFSFTPIWEDEPILTNIFQGDWNHQPEYTWVWVVWTMGCKSCTSSVDKEHWMRVCATSSQIHFRFKFAKFPTECPIGSMYGIFTYIWLILMVNVGKYTIHGSYGCLKCEKPLKV